MMIFDMATSRLHITTPATAPPPPRARRIPGLAALLLAAGSVLVAGCPKPQHTVPPRPASTGALAARLLLPPDADATKTLAELKKRADGGDRGAAWEVVTYLLDVYDLARMTGDTAARAWLWRAMGLQGTPAGGTAATHKVLRHFEEMVSRLAVQAAPQPPPPQGSPSTQGPHQAPLGARPSDAQVAALMALVASDRTFVTRPEAFPERVAALKSARRGPVGYAAELRLYAICAQAFRAAVLAPPERRALVVNHCLYALYDLDPAPHLARESRPPDPPWAAYQAGLGELLSRVAAAGHRPAELASRLQEKDRRFFAKNAHRLPFNVGSHIPELPPLPGGRPFDGGAAILRLPDQMVAGGLGLLRPEAADFRVILSRLYFTHGERTHMTLFAPGDLDTRHLKTLLERATATGFYTLGLGGGQTLTERVGYWRLTDQQPMTLRELPVSLAPSSQAARTLAQLTTEELLWDRACTRHDIGLVLKTEEIEAAGPDGRLEPMRPAGEYAEAAVAAAAALHRAFPGSCGLWVATEPGVTYAQLLSVFLRLSRKDRPELEAFRYLGLRLSPPPIPTSGNAFPLRVANRSKARVSLDRWPRHLAQAAPALETAIRPCYLDALDELPSRWAQLEVVATPEKALVSQRQGTSPEEEKLNACVAAAVETWHGAQQALGSLRFGVTLRP